MATSLTASGQTEVILQAVVNGTDEAGNTVSGALQFTELLPTTVADSQACTVSTGDDDQDSYINSFYGGDDCDDADVLIHPGGLETCDGVDNDGDGDTDEGFSDADLDGIADCVDPVDLEADDTTSDLDTAACSAAVSPDRMAPLGMALTILLMRRRRR